MRILCGMVVLGGLAGCTLQPPGLKKGEVSEKSVADFTKHIATGSNRQIERAMKKCFVAGAQSPAYGALFARANQTRTKSFGWEYIFWIRGKSPRAGGDGWVAVGVNAGTGTVRYAKMVVAGR